MASTSIFDTKFKEVIGLNVKNVLLSQNESEENIISNVTDWSIKNDNNLSCSYCRIEFTDSQQQREHYKLDWHRYNIKQSLICRLPLTEEEFDEKTGKDDLSSISGSDSEKEDSLDTYATAQGKIFLQNESGVVFSMYRCLVLDRKEELNEKAIYSRLKDSCLNNPQWTILMLGGGHFAGAIFKGNQPILHKTFHCYTVRAGQGGSQSSRDNKGGGSQPKSAGASLRRYNEQALVQHVKSIVDAWKTEIQQSSLIIYRASGPYNRSVLFNGSPPLLDRSDSRLRTIPFSTRRATFTEVKRVHSVLTSTQIYASLDEASQHFAQQKSPEIEQKKTKVRAAAINRAKSRERADRPLPGEVSESSDSSDDEALIVSSEPNEEGIFDVNNEEIDFGDLQEYDEKSPKKKTHRKKKPKKSKAKKQREKDEARRKMILEILFKGNLIKLKEVFNNCGNVTQDNDCNEEECDNEIEKKTEAELRNDFVNEVLDDAGNTLLHITAMNEHNEVLDFLLENDANPCTKNKNQQTAYTCTQSKEIRETLKRFARDNPDKFNYNKAQIPVNALTNEEIADKKRNQRKLKRDKEKEKKKENDIKKKEQLEKDRFLNLSDREKRALAAERRILNQSGMVISRCFLCASDMSGKVPFEYGGNRFCSIDCLKGHRMQHPLVLS